MLLDFPNLFLSAAHILHFSLLRYDFLVYASLFYALQIPPMAIFPKRRVASSMLAFLCRGSLVLSSLFSSFRLVFSSCVTRFCNLTILPLKPLPEFCSADCMHLGSLSRGSSLFLLLDSFIHTVVLLFPRYVIGSCALDFLPNDPSPECMELIAYFWIFLDAVSAWTSWMFDWILRGMLLVSTTSIYPRLRRPPEFLHWSVKRGAGGTLLELLRRPSLCSVVSVWFP